MYKIDHFARRGSITQKEEKTLQEVLPRQRVGAGLYGATEAPTAIDTSNINAVSTFKKQLPSRGNPFLEQ
jgi:hypothetical protein